MMPAFELPVGRVLPVPVDVPVVPVPVPVPVPAPVPVDPVAGVVPVAGRTDEA